MKREGQLIEKILQALPSSIPSSVSTSRLSRASRSHRAGTNPATTITTMPPSPAGAVRLGPGDDAAVLSPSGERDLVLSCDAFIEGIHFRPETHPPDSVGYKSLARATSDLAAMGAAPRYFLLTLALPISLSGKWLTELLAGMARASRQLGILIIGGDTTTSATVSISITVIGDVAKGRAITRSGARPGDLLYVSGTLGRAQLGLDLVLAGEARNRKFRSAVRPHLYPQIQIELGEWLARNRIATAMMDISDGLSTDLARLCAASKTGAVIGANKIPRVTIPAAAAKKLNTRRLKPLQMALHGGEDYELLFTVPPHRIKKLRGAPGFSSLVEIGEITRNRKLILLQKDGRKSPLKMHGWDPFR